MEEEKCTAAQYDFLKGLGICEENKGCYYDGKWWGTGEKLISRNPSTGEIIATTVGTSLQEYQQAVRAMENAKSQWASTPMPLRGEIVRLIGEAFRKNKLLMAKVLSIEVGKTLTQAQNEVQEVIDLCMMACGMSRSIGGSIFNSERPDHFMMEVWNPLGIIGVITAFNVPFAVFGWNTAIALICGDVVCWKGAPTTSLTMIAATQIISSVIAQQKINPNILTILQGGIDIGKRMTEDKRVALISFTGSTKIGKIIKKAVDDRFGKTILELGGNSASIILEDADLMTAYNHCTFAALGICGQRCTSLRRLLIHESVFDKFVPALVKFYQGLKIGDATESCTTFGPLHSEFSLKIYEDTMQRIRKEPNHKIYFGGNRIDRNGFFVEPTIVQLDKNSHILQEEYFCPILFVNKIQSIEEAIKINNDVSQGLSSSLFTRDISNVFKWVGPNGSDCGMVHVNIGTAGAEIGGAFGGEKETGGGREKGSDSWKQYMRRSTCTINHGAKMPLAQGVSFDL